MPGGTLKSAVVTVAAQNDAATVLGLPSSGNAAVQITGTHSATITFEATVDGTNWVSFHMLPSSSTTPASNTTAVGAWSASTGGYAGIRARCSAYTSGSPVVTVRYTAE